MSMNATDEVVSISATLRATVDFPDPEPPAIPIISGFSIETKATCDETGTHYAFFGCTRIAARAAGLPMKVRSISFAIIVAGLTACSGFKHGAPTIDSASTTVIQVDNQGFLDMTVYAERSTR